LAGALFANISSQNSKPKMNLQVPAARSTSLNAKHSQVVGLCLVLAAITFAVFAQTLGFRFINFDDGDYVTGNPVVAQGITFKGFVWAFARPHAANWHPLTWLSHMLDCQLFGLEPGAHHLTNVLLHAGTACALFLVLLRLTGAFWRCAFVAAVFAIHPLRAESVAWVSERKDVLSGFFFMLTLWAYVRYVEESKVQSPELGVQSSKFKVQGSAYGPKFSGPESIHHSPFTLHRSRWYLLSLAFFALGLMSKPMLVTLPVVLLLLDYWPLNRFEVKNRKSKIEILRALLWEKRAFLALSAGSCVVTLLAQRGAMKSFESLPLATRIGAALLSYKTYLVEMIYPAGLAAFYPFPLRPPFWGMAMAGLLLFVISAIAWAERRTRPWLLMGWLWYLVMLLPVLGLVQVGGQAHADRYTYLPQIGIYVAVTWLATESAVRWKLGQLPLGALMSLVIGILMVGTWKQTAYWRNSETLWRHALQCITGNTLAYVNLGHELFEQRRLDETITHYKKGLELQPNNRQFHNNLANALREQGRLDEALVHYEKAAQIDPGSAEAQFNLGKALGLKGKREEEVGRYEAALQIDPKFLPARMSLGNALVQRGKPELASSQFQRVLELRPYDGGAHLNLGLCFFQTGRMAEAKSEYEKAIQIAPKEPGILNNLAWLLATCPVVSLRDGNRAVELAEQANMLTGGDKPLILRTLAAALAETGHFPEAAEIAQHASTLAEAQFLPDLARQIQFEAKLYRAGEPFSPPEPTR
jgi:Flp pilus assembly protein TadD